MFLILGNYTHSEGGVSDDNFQGRLQPRLNSGFKTWMYSVNPGLLPRLFRAISMDAHATPHAAGGGARPPTDTRTLEPVSCRKKVSVVMLRTVRCEAAIEGTRRTRTRLKGGKSLH